MISVKELANKIQSYAEDLFNTDSAVTYRIPLDNELAVYVGWGYDFEPTEEGYLHSKSQPHYCICTKIAENGNYLWDDAYMPWYTDTEEVYDTDMVMSDKEDYTKLATWILSEYTEMKSLLETEKITF